MRKLLPLLLLLMCAPAFATVSLSLAGLVELVIYLIVVGAILALLIWLIGYAGVPEPFAKIARIIIMVFAVLLAINILLGFAGTPIFSIR